MDILNYINNIKKYSIGELLNKDIAVYVPTNDILEKLNKKLVAYNKYFCLYSKSSVDTFRERYGTNIYLKLHYDDNELDEEYQYGLTYYNKEEMVDDWSIIEIGDII